VNTLKTMVVLVVLAMVGYGLYVGLNNGFQFQNVPTETPDWLQQEMGTPGGMPPVSHAPAQQSPLAAPVSLGEQVPVANTSTPPTVAPSSPDVPQARYPADLQTRLGGPEPKPTNPSNSPVAIQPGNESESPAVSAIPPQNPTLTNSPENSLERANNPPGYPAAVGGPTPLSPSNPEAGPQTPPSVAGSLPALKEKNELKTSDELAFQAAMNSAKSQLAQGQLSTALLTLSIWYEDPRLQPMQQDELTQLLDQVAGSVIYSKKHLVEPAYTVGQGETLEQIAETYRVSSGLLAKINGIQNPATLTAGSQLKVVRGPFNATINGEKSELTLWLSGKYAGRFTLAMGPEFEGIVGPFVVQEKARGHAEHNHQTWIQLTPGYGNGSNSANTGPKVGIAGMQHPEQAKQGTVPGHIGVSIRDADDLFDILSQGSKVTIQR